MSTEEIWDFGFTAVDEEELESLQVTTKQLEDASTTLEECQNRLDKLYNTIQPLLNNLKKNSEKDYIYWPDRLRKVEAFSDVLDKIYQGS